MIKNKSLIPNHFRMTCCALLMGLAASLSMPAHADRETEAARYYEDALTRYERKDDAGAIIQLKNALKNDARMLPALVLLAQAHLRKGEPAAAEHAFAGAEMLGAARTQIAVYQAQAYLDQGKTRALLEKFGADGLSPQARLDMLLLRARAHIALSQLDAAMASAGLASQIKVREARALALQAQIQLYSGQYQAAKTTVQRALQSSPRDPAALNVLASISHAQGDLPAALRDYGRVIAVQPLSLDARLARAAIYLDLKRDQEAKVDIDYLQKHFSYDPRGAYLRALYAGRRGDAAGAREALQTVTRTLGGLSREFIGASDQLKLLGGLAHHALGEYERAKTYLVAYLEKRPNDQGSSATGSKTITSNIFSSYWLIGALNGTNDAKKDAFKLIAVAGSTCTATLGGNGCGVGGTSVPEPGTLILVGMGLLGLARVTRRRSAR